MVCPHQNTSIRRIFCRNNISYNNCMYLMIHKSNFIVECCSNMKNIDKIYIFILISKKDTGEKFKNLIPGQKKWVSVLDILLYTRRLK